jgi:hypothetical protein
MMMPGAETPASAGASARELAGESKSKLAAVIQSVGVESLHIGLFSLSATADKSNRDYELGLSPVVKALAVLQGL